MLSFMLRLTGIFGNVGYAMDSPDNDTDINPEYNKHASQIMR